MLDAPFFIEINIFQFVLFKFLIKMILIRVDKITTNQEGTTFDCYFVSRRRVNLALISFTNLG